MGGVVSRQKGHRQRSAPERRAIRERYSKPAPRRRTRLTERLRWDRSVTSGRRWSAVLAATVVSVVAFGLLANAIVGAGDGRDSVALLSAAGAALLMPVLLLVVGFVSRAPTPWRTAAVWSPAVVAVFVAVSFAAREPVTGYVLGVSMGVARALRADEGVHDRSWRMWTAVGLALYSKVVYLLSPGLAIVAAPLLPAAGMAIIDSVVERRFGGESRPLA